MTDSNLSALPSGQTIGTASGTGTILNSFATQGVIDGSSAASGNVGEVIQGSRSQASAVSLTATQYTDVTSITLQGNFLINAVGILNYNGSTTDSAQFFIGTATGNNNTGQDTAKNTAYLTSDAVAGEGLVSGNICQVVNPSSSTTYYLKVRIGSGTGLSAFGTITATRIR